jgi:hypothetical protein
LCNHSRTFQRFMEPKYSSLGSQHSCNDPYHEPDQSSPPNPLPISLRFILKLSTHLHLGLPSGFFPSGFHTKHASPLHSCYIAILSHPPWLDLSNYTCIRVQSSSSTLCSFLHPPVTSFVDPNILLQHPVLKHPHSMFLP